MEGTTTFTVSSSGPRINLGEEISGRPQGISKRVHPRFAPRCQTEVPDAQKHGSQDPLGSYPSPLELDIVHPPGLSMGPRTTPPPPPRKTPRTPGIGRPEHENQTKHPRPVLRSLGCHEQPYPRDPHNLRRTPLPRTPKEHEECDP